MHEIPDEAVRAAAEAIGKEHEDLREWDLEAFARAALDAAAPLLRTQARREAAAHILAVDALQCGLACPYCHAEARMVSVGDSQCRNGHKYWRGQGQSGATLMTALRRLADDDELPLMPALRPADADGVLAQARRGRS